MITVLVAFILGFTLITIVMAICEALVAIKTNKK